MCAGSGWACCSELAAYPRPLRMRIGAKAAVLDVRLWCALRVTLPQRPLRAAPRQPTAQGLGPGDIDAKQAGCTWARGPRPGIPPPALAACSWKAGADWRQAALVVVLMDCVMVASIVAACKQQSHV